ncbi:MAG TPA: hypothetical protein VNQ48_07740 [Microbacteriaceae bacterium]|nr:hypothetical protein [Microbacteriaceae bacterium]
MTSERATGNVPGEMPEDDETVVMRPAAAAPAAAGDDDATVAIRRPGVADAGVAADAAADDDATVPVSEDDTVRRPRDDDATVAMSGGAAERTPTAARNAGPPHSSDPRPSAPRRSGKPVMSAPKRRRRRGLHPAPVPAGYGERAVRASGAGAVSTYRARAIPRPPGAAPHVPGTALLERVTGGTPSVRRESRRFARVAVAGFAASCVVSVVGLTLIVRAAFGL